LNHKLEITVNSLTSAFEAQKGGADRVELCDNFPEGGTTPSYGNILVASRNLNIDLFVIIRPRGGDFLYDDFEFEIMKKDIIFSKNADANGVVFGVLMADGSIDIDRNAELVELAKPMQTTFHRAFDMTSDAFQALEDIIELRFDRVLTSGQQPTATDGAGLITELVKTAGNRIIVMPGSGINEDNILELVHRTKAKEFHASFRKKVKSKMTFKKDNVIMGGAGSSEYVTEVADLHKIARVKQILSSM